MPTYAYRCRDCGHQFDIFQKFSDDALTVCPNCEGSIHRVIQRTGVVFKGTGFYINDSKSSGKDAKPRSDDAPPAADKPAASADGADKAPAGATEKPADKPAEKPAAKAEPATPAKAPAAATSRT